MLNYNGASVSNINYSLATCI